MKLKAWELKCIKAKLASLRRIAGQIHTIDVRECNRGISPALDAKRKRLIAEAGGIAGDLGLHVYHQPDPRGGTLWLIDREDSGQADLLYTNGCNV